MAKKTKKKPLTKKQKLAVSIAKDALAQVQNGIYFTEPGTIIKFPQLDTILTNEYIEDYDPAREVELQPFVIKGLRKLSRDGESCDVCARGALLLSTIKKDNKFKARLGSDTIYNDEDGSDTTVLDVDFTRGSIVGTYDPNGAIDERLLKVFSERTIALAERVLEEGYNAGFLSEADADAAIAWSASIPKEKNKLIAILKSIIVNKGELVIPAKYYEISYEAELKLGEE